MVRRRTLRQDSEPPEWVVPLEHAEHAIGDAGPADAMESIASGDEVAADFLLAAFVPEPDLGLLAAQVVDAYVAHLKQKRTAVSQTALDQILHHLLLAINGNTLIHERLEVDTVQAALDADIDAP